MFRRPLVPLLSLLFAALSFPALAQGLDSRVEINMDQRHPTLHATYVVYTNWGEQVEGENVVLELDSGGEIQAVYPWNNSTVCDQQVRSLRCTTPAASALFGGMALTVRFPEAGTYTTHARISSTSVDPNPADNVATHTVSVAGLPSLRPYGVADLLEGSSVDPGGAGTLRIGLQNDGEVATNVVLRATLPEGGRFTGMSPWNAGFCSLVSETEAVCRFAETRPVGTAQYNIDFVAPDRPDGGTFPFVVTADADQDDFDPSNDVSRVEVLLRDLIEVTNAADDGPGSLRQALLESRTACDELPCLIGFRSETPLVIQPRSPLPALRGSVKIDGGTMKTILDGSLLPAGGALSHEDGCEFRVNRMVIHQFPGHAIEAHQVAPPSGTTPCGLESLLFVTNSELIGNLRGVVTHGISATITGNVIRDHGRAGIFADGGYYTEIARNEITGNGASGVFLRPSSASSWLTPGGEIFDNVVRDNREWGIARAAFGAVNIRRNAVSGNHLYGIDYGLDLSTPNAPNKPVLFSATYDPVRNATVIRGTVPRTVRGDWPFVDLYASSSLSRLGYPEAEQVIGGVSAAGDFETLISGDLRGKWITATGTRNVDYLFLSTNGFRYQTNDTSELSDAVQVE